MQSDANMVAAAAVRVGVCGTRRLGAHALAELWTGRDSWRSGITSDDLVERLQRVDCGIERQLTATSPYGHSRRLRLFPPVRGVPPTRHLAPEVL